MTKKQELTPSRQYVPELVDIDTRIYELENRWFTTKDVIELFDATVTRSLQARVGHYIKAMDIATVKSGTNSRKYLLG